MVKNKVSKIKRKKTTKNEKKENECEKNVLRDRIFKLDVENTVLKANKKRLERELTKERRLFDSIIIPYSFVTGINFFAASLYITDVSTFTLLTFINVLLIILVVLSVLKYSKK